MKVFNTLTRSKEEFIPLEKNKVKMYVCGPTVYDFIHIGNARPFVVFDTVRRYFLYKGYDVTYVQNFTDIDDKIINKAIDENVDTLEISERYINESKIDSKGLNVMDATHHPKVTEEVDEIIEMVKSLIDKGYAYEKNGSVYFDTTAYEQYGKLSNRKLEDLLSGARIAVDSEKNNSTDFILWKPAKANEPKWSSPWGDGRPGWHIECSVMAKKYLGNTIDIHAGGEDLIFPHHENEIAQSQCANGEKFANYWLHNGFINIDNEKMSKSKGNFFTVRDIVEKYSYEEIRFFILSGHYRSPINFSEELMISSRTALNRIKTSVANLEFLINNSTVENQTLNEKNILEESYKFKKEFEAAMEDDFNTADAISSIFELVKFINVNTNETSSKEFSKNLLDLLNELMDILGMNFENNRSSLEDEVEALIKKREDARKNKDWTTADAIRDELNKKGIVLEDTPLGVKWSIKDNK